MATLEAKSIKKFFGNTEVLKGIDLAVKEGEFIDDALFVLGADYYVQINGGGISLIREFSKKPYFINHSLIFMKYSFDKVYKFQTANQIYKTRRQKYGIKIPLIEI